MSSDLILILHAAGFAAQKHRDQRRKDADASPYINQSLALADILARKGSIPLFYPKNYLIAIRCSCFGISTARSNRFRRDLARADRCLLDW